MKNYLKTYMLFFILLFIYLIIISFLYYLELFNYNILYIINYIFMIMLFFIIGFRISHLERNKGYLKGFIISSSIIIPFSIITLIISNISFSNIVYYVSLILISITGGIIGVNK